VVRRVKEGKSVAKVMKPIRKKQQGGMYTNPARETTHLQEQGRPSRMRNDLGETGTGQADSSYNSVEGQQLMLLSA
jgi:hypothetical protein